MVLTLLTPEKLAGIFDVKVQTILEWARTGRIPSVKVTNKVVRFKLDDVSKALGIDAVAEVTE
jgi:excisionase family DNA binding protein